MACIKSGLKVAFTALQRHALFLHHRGQWIQGHVGCRVRVMRDDEVIQPVRFQRAYPVQQFIAHKGQPRAAVLNVVPQFFGRVHRVQWNHDGIGAQDRIESDDELRGVLHIQQDTITFCHAQMLQISCNRQNLRLQGGIAGRPTIVVQRGPRRPTAGRGFQISGSIAVGHIQMRVKPGRPMRRGRADPHLAVRGNCHVNRSDRRITVCSRTATASAIADQSLCSSGQWLRPSLEGTKTSATGICAAMMPTS